jgi:hypothetical protein
LPSGEEIGSRLGEVADDGLERAETVAAVARETAGTIFREVASWFVNAETDTSVDDEESN